MAFKYVIFNTHRTNLQLEVRVKSTASAVSSTPLEYRILRLKCEKPLTISLQLS